MNFARGSVVTETLAVKRNDPELRELARRSSLVLILVSTVFGAISGVGIWVVAGLISPAAISALIHTYVWGWAIEWVFFILEIVAALVYYTTWDKISKGAHLLVGWLYFIGAYFSLVVINGIVTFMLTPGRWLETNAFWDGFFNPTYWPSLVLRTGIVILMATAFMVFPALRTGTERRAGVLRYIGWWVVAGALLSYAGYRWWEAMLPATVRNLFSGAEPALTALASTRSLTLWSLTVALVVGLVILIVAPRLARPATALVMALAAFAFFGGYERLREGARKPFLIHSHIFSNGLLVSDIGAINEEGVLARSGWATRGADDSLSMGRNIFRTECSSCHTLDGYQSIRQALPTYSDVLSVAGGGVGVFESECGACHTDVSEADMREMLPTPAEIAEDPGLIHDLNQGMIYMAVSQLQEMGESYRAAPRGEMIDTAELHFLVHAAVCRHRRGTRGPGGVPRLCCPGRWCRNGCSRRWTMNPNLIPAVDPAGLPGPPWLFHVLLVFTLFLHLIFMNLTLGGTLLAVVAHLKSGGRRDDFRGVLAGRLVAINNYGISLTITTGVAPLLFIQLLYQQYFYTATILLAPVWFAMLLLLMVGYYAAYLYKFRGAPTRGSGGGLWLSVSAGMFLLIAMVHVAVNLVHAQPEMWGSLADGSWSVFSDPTYWPRLLHFIFAGLGFAALVTAWWAVRRASEGVDTEINTAIAGWAWRWALWTTVLQVVDGFLLLMLLPRPVLLGIMSGGLATLGPLTLAILVGVGLLMMLARVSNPVEKPGLVSGTLGAMTLTIAVMSITRHQVRALYLEPSAAQFNFLIVPQWGNFVLFALLLVAGLATVGYMLWRVLTSPASGADAA